MKHKNMTVFRQTEELSNSHVFGVIFMLVGALFFSVCVCAIRNGNYEGAVAGILGVAVILHGFSMFRSYLCSVKFTENEIFLMIGPFRVQRMAISEVRVLGYANIWASVSKDEEYSKRNTTMCAVVLSPRTPSEIRSMARRWVEPAVESKEYTSEAEREHAILQSATEAYMQYHMSGFRLAKGEGIWLEYTPKRFEIIKKLLPSAEDFVTENEDME